MPFVVLGANVTVNSNLPAFSSARPLSVLTGVRPKVEVYPLAKVNEAYERMISNKARFRVVLKM